MIDCNQKPNPIRRTLPHSLRNFHPYQFSQDLLEVPTGFKCVELIKTTLLQAYVRSRRWKAPNVQFVIRQMGRFWPANGRESERGHRQNLYVIGISLVERLVSLTSIITNDVTTCDGCSYGKHKILIYHKAPSALNVSWSVSFVVFVPNRRRQNSGGRLFR